MNIWRGLAIVGLVALLLGVPVGAQGSVPPHVADKILGGNAAVLYGM